jgi:trigger factor
MSVDTTHLKIEAREADEGSWSRRLSITVPAERVQRTRDAVATQITRNVRLPGFRKGKLPAKVMEQKFGRSIDQETLDRTIQEAYREALQSADFVPISQGTVDNVQFERGADVTFEVEFEVRPEVELARVSGFTASRPPAEVGEEDVDSVIERLRDERAAWHPLDEDAKPDYGDQVMVEITALDDDEQTQEGEEPRSYRFAIGEGQAIPEVEESILTLKPGEEGDFTVHFPEDFPDEEQRGKEQHLHIKIVDAKRKELPVADDEFATSVGDFENMEALRARILEDLQQDAVNRADADVRGQLVEQIIEANPFQVPNSMIDRYLDHMTGHAHGDGQEEEHQHTPEELERISRMREGLLPQAEMSLKRMLVVERLAETEGLRATQDEIDARVEELAEQHDRSPSDVWIQLEKGGQLEMLEREITEDKVFEYLISQNTVA